MGQEQLALGKKRDDKRYRVSERVTKNRNRGEGKTFKKRHGGLCQCSEEDNENQTNMIHGA